MQRRHLCRVPLLSSFLSSKRLDRLQFRLALKMGRSYFSPLPQNRTSQTSGRSGATAYIPSRELLKQFLCLRHPLGRTFIVRRRGGTAQVPQRRDQVLAAPQNAEIRTALRPTSPCDPETVNGRDGAHRRSAMPRQCRFYRPVEFCRGSDLPAPSLLRHLPTDVSPQKDRYLGSGSELPQRRPSLADP